MRLILVICLLTSFSALAQTRVRENIKQSTLESQNDESVVKESGKKTKKEKSRASK